MKKRIVSLVLCCLILCAGSVQVFAAEPNVYAPSAVSFPISPYMDYIIQANGTLYIIPKVLPLWIVTFMDTREQQLVWKSVQTCSNIRVAAGSRLKLSLPIVTRTGQA